MIREPKLIQAIEVGVPKGDGTKGNPSRIVMQYYTTEGEFLAENDSWPPEKQKTHGCGKSWSGMGMRRIGKLATQEVISRNL